MTRDELKATLTPIVCDLTLTKEERSSKLGPVAAQFMNEREEEGPLDHEEIMNEWNNVMADIAEENNLGRQ